MIFNPYIQHLSHKFCIFADMLQFIARINDRYSVAELAQMAIEGGCHWVELDLPDASDDFVRETALELKNLCMETGTFLTIVDRPEVAKEAGLHGVQLRGANARRVHSRRSHRGHGGRRQRYRRECGNSRRSRPRGSHATARRSPRSNPSAIAWPRNCRRQAGKWRLPLP